jgi:hypothetical protein
MSDDIVEYDGPVPNFVTTEELNGKVRKTHRVLYARLAGGDYSVEMTDATLLAIDENFLAFDAETNVWVRAPHEFDRHPWGTWGWIGALGLHVQASDGEQWRLNTGSLIGRAEGHSHWEII